MIKHYRVLWGGTKSPHPQRGVNYIATYDSDCTVYSKKSNCTSLSFAKFLSAPNNYLIYTHYSVLFIKLQALRTPFVWYKTPAHWVIASRPFEEKVCLLFQGAVGLLGPSRWKHYSFENIGNRLRSDAASYPRRRKSYPHSLENPKTHPNLKCVLTNTVLWQVYRNSATSQKTWLIIIIITSISHKRETNSFCVAFWYENYLPYGLLPSSHVKNKTLLFCEKI